MKFVLLTFVIATFCLSTQARTVVLTEEYGDILSPNYPAFYGDNEDDTWTIVAPENYQVVIYFSVFNLEDSFDENLGGACVYDYVEIENLGSLKRFCGNRRQFPEDAPIPLKHYRSQNNTMTVRFVSDYSNEEPHFGFVAHYYIDDKDECAEMARQVQTAHEDWDELVYCNQFCINTPGSYHCSCRHGFVLHENGHTCKASCENQQITATEGFVASPDYPQPYSRLTDCDWTITVPPGFSLNLQFSQQFKIEDHPEYDDCVYDYLKISYDSNETFYCHGIPNNGSVIETNVREVRLDFHTDNSVELAGFNITFTTTRQRCNEARDAPQNGTKSDNLKGFYEFEDQIVFLCNTGYNLVGENSIVCLNNGSWSSPSPICQIKSCGNPDQLRSVPNSYIDFEGELQYTYGDVLTVECNDWYEWTSGLKEWWCSDDAIWVPTEQGGNATEIPVCTPECGEKNGEDNALLAIFIAQGKISRRHEWPWMVFINLGPRPNVGDQFGTCGGFLISPEFVLTAAHCVSSNDQTISSNGQLFNHRVHVWLGAHNRYQDFFMPRNSVARSVGVNEIIRHPDYNVRPLDSDLALLRLNETVIMSNFVRPICLPNTTADFNELMIGTTGEVAGWGITENGSVSYILRHVELPTVSRRTCWSAFQTLSNSSRIRIRPNFTLTENMFCAGFATSGSGATCMGDSGGPFIVKRRNPEKYYAYGVVSFGKSNNENTGECGESVSYTVFVNLNRNMTTWIHEHIG